jgi:hypothetical protein
MKGGIQASDAEHFPHARSEWGDNTTVDRVSERTLMPRAGGGKAMKMYDIYRGREVAACVRLHDGGRIEWAYRQERSDGEGFWWNTDEQRLIEELIRDFPQRPVLAVSAFTIRQRWDVSVRVTSE